MLRNRQNRWDRDQCHPDFVLSNSDLTIRIFEKNIPFQHRTVRARAQVPFDATNDGIVEDYYELDFTKKGMISIGLASADFPLVNFNDSHVGMIQCSYGINDWGEVKMSGELQTMVADGSNAAETFGCALSLGEENQRQIFFTKNGQSIGSIDIPNVDPIVDLYPTVSFKGQWLNATANFTGPFKYRGGIPPAH